EASERISGDVPYRIFAGYDEVVRVLSGFGSHRVDVRLNTIVDEIEWRPGHVRANQFEADCAIITLPLGVLQAGMVHFSPDLEAKRIAAQELVMGHVVKTILCFDEPFWEE